VWHPLGRADANRAPLAGLNRKPRVGE